MSLHIWSKPLLCSDLEFCPVRLTPETDASKPRHFHYGYHHSSLLLIVDMPTSTA